MHVQAVSPNACTHLQIFTNVLPRDLETQTFGLYVTSDVRILFCLILVLEHNGDGKNKRLDCMHHTGLVKNSWSIP